MYNVVFVLTRETGPYEGIVLSATFENKEKFKIWYTNDIAEMARVMEEGVSEERCHELEAQTPQACLRAIAKAEIDALLEPMLFLSEHGGIIVVS